MVPSSILLLILPACYNKIGDEKDKYGRLIADCFVDGYNVNARLVYEGMALAYRRYSKKYVPEEDQAKAAKRGLWAGRFIPSFC